MIEEQLVGNLEKIFGNRYVIIDEEILRQKSRDLWSRNLLEKPVEVKPASVIVMPNGDDYVLQLEKLVALAIASNPPLHIIPRGGGSGVCGAANTRGGEIIVDLSQLTQVRLLSFPSATQPGLMHVQAGTSGKQIDDVLKSIGDRYSCGHYPASYYISQFGGWVSTGSSGQYSIRFGKIGNIVQGVEGIDGLGRSIFLKNGDVYKAIGLEGTTMIITGGLMPIFKIPPIDGYFSFQFNQFCEMNEFLKAIFMLQQEEQSIFRDAKIYALRCYDWMDYNLIAKPNKKDTEKTKAEWTKKLQYFIEKTLCKQSWTLAGIVDALKTQQRIHWTGVIYIAADSESALGKVKGLLVKMVNQFHGRTMDAGIAKQWHENRFKLDHSKVVDRFKAGVLVDTFECTPTWDNLIITYESIRGVIWKYGLVGAHIGLDLEGPYIYFTFAIPSFAGKNLYHELWSKILSICISSGAKINHHHGIGKLKTGIHNELASIVYSPEWYSMAIMTKKEMDPQNILNPGKLFCS